MAPDADRSFDEAMARLRADDQDAARQVFERYVRRLTALAGTRLGGKFRRKVDPEDVVQSVFNSFFQRQRDDSYKLNGWDGLWGLLAKITIHKCGHKIEHFQAACRDVANEASLLLITDESRADWEAVAHDPTPSAIAILDETIVSLLRELDERDGQIFLLALQGWSTKEIRNEVHCSRKDVRNVLNSVRRRLEGLRDGSA
jgi:DNA-directed RNA polymerase specialized sigma24 family protein